MLHRDVTLSLFGEKSRLCFPNKAIEKSSCCISNDFELLKKTKFTTSVWEIFRQAVICTNQDMLCFPNKDKVTSLMLQELKIGRSVLTQKFCRTSTKKLLYFHKNIKMTKINESRDQKFFIQKIRNN
jgi:hypothetical protein